MLTITIRKPTEHKLSTCMQVDIENNIPWNPEEIQHKGKIKLEPYNDLLDDVNKERNINSRKTIDSRDTERRK